MNIIKKTLSYFLMFLMVIPSINVNAAQRTAPTWYDQNTVGTSPDWHYRVPISIPASAAINSTISVDVDFASLLSTLSINGTFDVNSPRVVRANGSLSTTQEFNNNIYANTTNAIGTRGEIRFLNEDNGPSIYYLYFDITQNGAKASNPQAKINGRFEQDGVAGQTQPTGWNAPTVSAGFDSQLRPSENPSITTDGGVVGNGASPKVVAGTPLTGNFSYLIGARTNNEATSGFPRVTFTKTIVVPASNPGNLTFRYRIQGWDSNVNNNTTQFDYFNASIVGTTTTNMVGPSLNNYTALPFSPNYGVNQAGGTNSGYGQYNAWDFDTNGVRRPQGTNTAMTIARGAEPWFTVNQSLAGYAGQTITLRFVFNNTVLYKSWTHIDDVEWSVVNATLGTPEAFGVSLIIPITTTNIIAGSVLNISANVDANPNAFVFANIYDSTGALVASNIRLYNDGTRGSNAGTLNIWTNNGSDNTSPTYQIPGASISSSNWTVRVFAKDLSTSTVGAQNGLVKIPTLPTTEIETNFYNIAESKFNVIGVFASSGVNLKTVSILSDPINGSTNPKAIPGAIVLYGITITNTTGGAPDNNSISIYDFIPTNTKLCIADIGGAGSGPVSFTQGTNVSGLTYSFVSFATTTDDLSFSNNNRTTWTYVPTPDTDNCDANVTDILVNPKGTMNVNTANPPSFTINFKVQIK